MYRYITLYKAGENGFGRKMLAAACCDSFKPGAKLEFHVGWSGCTRPPTMGGGGGGRANRSAKGGGVGEVLRGF